MFRYLSLAFLLAAAPLQADTLYRDPMRPYEPPSAATSRAEPAGFRLSTVLISSSRRVAVINGQVCRVGEWVDGAEVIAIESDWVRLRVDSRDVVVAFAGRGPREIIEAKAAP